MNGISLKTKLNSILTSVINCLPEGSVTKVVGVNGNGCLKVTDVSSLGGGGAGIPQTLSISGNELSISQGNTITLPVVTAIPITDVYNNLSTGNTVVLTNAPKVEFHVLIYRGGLLQNPNQYTRTGVNVVFNTGFSSSVGGSGGEEIIVVYYA